MCISFHEIQWEAKNTITYTLKRGNSKTVKKSDTVEKSTFAAILIKSESVGFLDLNKNTHKKNISGDKY